MSRITQKKSDATKVVTIAAEVCKQFADLGARIQSASPKTCSVYIKFSAGSGSLRISNHPTRYNYMFNIRIDRGFKDIVDKSGTHITYHASLKNKDKFYKFMREQLNATS